jgi:hypothetical protein
MRYVKCSTVLNIKHIQILFGTLAHVQYINSYVYDESANLWFYIS